MCAVLQVVGCSRLEKSAKRQIVQKENAVLDPNETEVITTNSHLLVSGIPNVMFFVHTTQL